MIWTVICCVVVLTIVFIVSRRLDKNQDEYEKKRMKLHFHRYHDTGKQVEAEFGKRPRGREVVFMGTIGKCDCGKVVVLTPYGLFPNTVHEIEEVLA